MKYYITKPINEKAETNEYRIIKVKDADDTNFLQDYGDKVIAWGYSLMEALLRFEQQKSGQ